MPTSPNVILFPRGSRKVRRDQRFDQKAQDRGRMVRRHPTHRGDGCNLGRRYLAFAEMVIAASCRDARLISSAQLYGTASLPSARAHSLRRRLRQSFTRGRPPLVRPFEQPLAILGIIRLLSSQSALLWRAVRITWSLTARFPTRLPSFWMLWR
jgi:hypothetical protein